ncbi:MAG TPA: hypothetical protein VFS28_02580 [Gemmatimonadales bacterium]|jgi:hypothetical protein|nr:hypothetical protein [Gemmatimonadales bacterium]
MTLTRLALAWAVTAAWFTLTWTGSARLAGRPAPWTLRGPFGALLLEAALLTLVAALWFGSLGHGGWWLLFLVLGLLQDGPVRTRHRGDVPVEGARRWLILAGDLVRFLAAGGLLAWRLS